MLCSIRTRTIHAPDGGATVEHTVRCRWHGCAVPLDECLACPARIGFKIDPRGDSWVACTARRR